LNEKEDAVKSLISKAVLLGQVFLLVAFCSYAWSAPIPEAAKPGAVEKSLKPAPVKEPPKLPEITVEEDERGVLKGAAGVKFQLKDVLFEDNWIFSSEQLKPQVAGYIGRTIEINELSKITDIITAYYKKRGYFLSRAYIPPQTIKDGVVLVKVREGRLGEIIIKGNKRYSRELIRNTLTIVRSEGAVRTENVERGLLSLMDYPGLHVAATFKPGDRPGTSDIVLDVKEDRFVKFGLDYNNFGSKYVSEHRIGVSADLYNMAGLGDALYFHAVGGLEGVDKLNYGRLEYVLPLGYSGTRMGLFYNQMSYELVGDLAAMDAKGEMKGGGIWFSYPIIRTRNVNWYLDAGFDMKNVKQDILSQEVGKDSLRYAHLGTTLQWVDVLHGSNTISLRGYTGFAGMLNGMDQDYKHTIRTNTDVVYNKAELEVYRIQQLPLGFAALINGTAQYSRDRLPSSEEMSIGGAGTVRGYSQSELSGDSGLYANVELRIPILGLTELKWFGNGKTVGDTLQLAAFYDYGLIRISDPLPGELGLDKSQIGGAGAGLRFTYSPYVRFKVDWAKHVNGDDPRDPDAKDNGVWYFQAAVSF
jgi:hemolysin activation/secretion protein